jgi:ferredoxin
MPWVNKEMCTGCGLCAQVCPVEAIVLTDDGKASINDDLCVRCGSCHDACPQEAVRHDSERIPRDVATNLQWVIRVLDHFETAPERAAFIGRIGRHFSKEKKVIEKTLAALETVGEDTSAGLDAAIRALLEPQTRQTN